MPPNPNLDDTQVRPPMPPVFFFMIDVSVSAINSGMLATTTAAIKSTLDNLPGADRTRVGFLTYDAHLHFYNLKSTLTQPQMMVSRCMAVQSILRSLTLCTLSIQCLLQDYYRWWEASKKQMHPLK